MTDLFKKLVNGDGETNNMRVIGDIQPTKYHEKKAEQRQETDRQKQERLNEFPRLVHEKRLMEQIRAEQERRKELREYNSLTNKTKRLINYLFDL